MANWSSNLTLMEQFMRLLAHWLEVYSPNESLDLLRTLALKHAERAGPKAAPIVDAIKRDDLSDIVLHELDLSSEDWTASTLYHCRQAVALFSKLEPLDIGIDKEKAAYDKFVLSEESCKLQNEAFRASVRGEFSFLRGVEPAMLRAQRKIAQVLGPLPTHQELGYRFGKGATTLTPKRKASLREKFAAGVSCSEECLPIAKAILEELPLLSEAIASYERVDEDGEEWFGLSIHLHDGRLEFVPKNVKTYRSVIVEPVLNGLYQLALGDHMTRRLAAFGVDLKDQTRNQRLALEGSLTGELATLDLSAASDSVSLELIFSLLPLDWAMALARGRTGHVTYRGRRLTLEKFSSMGNGFTFPLQSLVFWALARAVCDKDDVVSVYGDDIILPSAKSEEFTRLLQCLGFTVNEEKSYHSGPFRESCGRDYYRGIDVRPFFQKEWVSPRTLFTLHNFYVRRGMDDFAELIQSWIHPALRLYGPDGYGDGHLLGPWDRVRKPAHERRGWAGYTFSTFSLKGRKDIRPQLPGDYVLPAYSIYQRSAVSLVPADAVQWTAERKLLSWSRGHGEVSENLPLPDHNNGDGTFVKATSLPGTEDRYKRITIYTFGE
jgi:hypothetical protein